MFKLHTPAGFPADLTADVAREQNLSIDEASFEDAMKAQKSRAQSASKFGMDYTNVIQIEHVHTSRVMRKQLVKPMSRADRR